MSTMYLLDMKEEIEAMHEAVCYLRSIGFSYDVLDALLSVPSGAVKCWILRGPDGFHPLLISGWYKPSFCLSLILCALLGIWESMEKNALEEITEDEERERRAADEYWEDFRKNILSLGGVSAYKGDVRSEEVVVVSNDLIRKNGLQPGRVAEILADYFPGYGVETEQEFFDLCDLYTDFQAENRLRKSRR